MQTANVSFSTEAAADAAGVTYRMLDYWLRTGAITIDADPTPGSGKRRTFTLDEVEALVACVDRYHAAQAVIRDFGSGVLWDAVRNGQAPARRRVKVPVRPAAASGTARRAGRGDRASRPSHRRRR
jgi:hypothetical protein